MDSRLLLAVCSELLTLASWKSWAMQGMTMWCSTLQMGCTALRRSIH